MGENHGLNDYNGLNQYNAFLEEQYEGMRSMMGPTEQLGVSNGLTKYEQIVKANLMGLLADLAEKSGETVSVATVLFSILRQIYTQQPYTLEIEILKEVRLKRLMLMINRIYTKADKEYLLEDIESPDASVMSAAILKMNHLTDGYIHREAIRRKLEDVEGSYSNMGARGAVHRLGPRLQRVGKFGFKLPPLGSQGGRRTRRKVRRKVTRREKRKHK
jgi:hypothetical protein